MNRKTIIAGFLAAFIFFVGSYSQKYLKNAMKQSNTPIGNTEIRRTSQEDVKV